MHAVSMGGPALYLLLGLFYGSWCLSVFVVYDSLRRGLSGFDSRRHQMLWTVPEAIYLVLFTLNLFRFISDLLGYTVILLTLPAIAHQVAYLLRVVFPSPKRMAVRSALSDEAEEAYIAEIVAAVQADEPLPEPGRDDDVAPEDTRES